jgi:hypothetical protein
MHAATKTGFLLMQCSSLASNKALMQARSLYNPPLKDWFNPDLQDYIIPDYDFKALRSISKYRFGVEYLGIAENPPCFPVYGLIMGNKRMLINLCCSAANRVNQSDPCSWTNVLFILNTCSPATFLSMQAIEKFGWRSDIPISLRVQSEKLQSVYPAPPRSQFTDLNILGMDFLQRNKVRTIIDSEYGTFMLDTSQPTNRVPSIDIIH